MIARVLARARGPHPSYLAGAAIVIAVACEMLFLLRRSGEWSQSQLGAIEWQGGAAQLVAPIGAAVAAAGAQAVGGSSLGVIARLQRRDRASVRLTGLRLAVPLVAVHLVAMLIAVGVARSRGLEGAPPVAGWLPGALMIAAFSCVGALMGWRIRTVLAAPIAAAVAFGVLVMLSFSLDLPLLDLSGAANVIGAVLRGDFVTASALAALLIAVVAVAATPSGALSWSYAIAGAAFAGLVGLLAVGPSERLRTDREPAVCVGAVPQVCGFPERRRLLAPTRAAILDITAAVRRLDPAAPPFPSRWTEGPVGNRAGVSQLDVADPDDHAGLVTDVVSALLQCVPDDVFVDAPELEVWLARELYGPEDPSISTLALGIPAPRLAPESLRRAARRAVRDVRRYRCR